MAKTYVITSGKGGVGKTTTAVNLGAAFNKFKEDVVILDANFTTPNVGLHFGAPIVPVSLNHVLKGEADVGEAIYEHESGTKIIPCSLSLKEIKKVNMPKIEQVSKQLKKITDHVIIDCAAGLGDEAKSAIKSADDIIVVVNPNILSVTDALKTIKLAEEMNKDVKGVIVTRVKNNKNEMKLSSIKEMLEVPILGIVPEDSNIEESVIKKDAVIHTKPKSKSSRAYMDIAAKMLGKKRRPESFIEKLVKVLKFS